jgi:hypothetical protein
MAHVLQWNYNQLISGYKTAAAHSPEANTFVYDNEGTEVLVMHMPILSKKQSDMHLFAISTNEKPQKFIGAGCGADPPLSEFLEPFLSHFKRR